MFEANGVNSADEWEIVGSEPFVSKHRVSIKRWICTLRDFDIIASWRERSDSEISENERVKKRSVHRAKSYPRVKNPSARARSVWRSRSLPALTPADFVTNWSSAEEPCLPVSPNPSAVPHARRNAIDFSLVNAASTDTLMDEASSEIFPSSEANENHEAVRCPDDWSTLERDQERGSAGSLQLVAVVTPSIDSEGSELTTPQTPSRICPEEMLYYYSFTQSCKTIRNLYLSQEGWPSSSLFVTRNSESLTFPTSPSLRLSAKQLSAQLDCCYAYMHGGRDMCEAPIICLPHYPALRDVSDQDFNNVMQYLTSITSVSVADVGFVLIIDRRKEKWSALRATLIRIAGYFPACLRMVLVLRPIGFLQGAMSDIAFRWQRDDFSMKVPVTMISTLDELYNYVQPTQLPPEFGGSFDYDHQNWLRNRLLIEDFSARAIVFSESLEQYGMELAETELPNDIPSTEVLIRGQEAKTLTYKTQLENILKEAVNLRVNVSSTRSGSIIAELLDNDVDFARSYESNILQSFSSLVEETELAFEKFWKKHTQKLNQCLELRQFEQEYREVKCRIDGYVLWIQNQTQNIGSSVNWVESMIEELEERSTHLKKDLSETSLLIKQGELLLGNEHYASDSIGPKKDELKSISSHLEEGFKNRRDVLLQSLSFLKKIDKGNQWCERGMNLLASQTLDKTCTFDSAEQALDELERFFNEEKPSCFENSKEETKDEFPLSWCSEFEALFDNLHQRMKEVRQLYEKRKSSFKKITTRHGNRPVQLVEPSKKSVKQVTPASSHRPKTAKSLEKATKRNSVTSDQDKTRSVHVATLPQNETVSQAHEEAVIKQQHVMNELLHTEEVYVNEVQSIVEGYGKAIDSPDQADLVPEELKGKTDVLLGNMDEICRFHGDIFLNELKECKETPTKVGKCFIRRKENFRIYCKYCQNSIQSEHLRSRVGEHHPFFVECQRKLGHRLSLGAYLLKPIQRLTKYQLLLQQMLKHETKENAELKEAIQAMLEILKSVNDSMHQIAIVGYQGDLSALGNLLMQGAFSVQVDHKKAGVKSLTKSRFSKSMHRHLFLYEKEFLFCKQQNMEAALNNDNGHPATSSPNATNSNRVYLFKHCLQNHALPNDNRSVISVLDREANEMNAIGITENIKSDPRKFEIWYHGREDVYTITASTPAVKQEWMKQIKKVLESQPKSSITPPDPRQTDHKPVVKVKRSLSAKKSKQATTGDPPKPTKTEKVASTAERSAKGTLKKKASTLTRSASLGKSKDKVLRRKNTEICPRSIEKTQSRKMSDERTVKPSETVSSEGRPSSRRDALASQKARKLKNRSNATDVGEVTDMLASAIPAQKLNRLVAIQDRVETTRDEIVLRAGDVVDVLEERKDGWVKVRNESTEGWAPTSHLISPTSSASLKEDKAFAATAVVS